MWDFYVHAWGDKCPIYLLYEGGVSVHFMEDTDIIEKKTKVCVCVLK